MSAAPRRSCSPFDAGGIAGVAGRAGVAGVAALIRRQTRYSERGCPAHTRLQRAHNQPRLRPPGHTRSPARSATALRATPRRPNGGFCTIRRIATACRSPNAAIPPIRPRQPPPRPPPATANPATPGRLPAQPPLSGPPNGGFCTIRRIATACRRRVAPLMLQFPHLPTPTTAPTATGDGPPGTSPATPGNNAPGARGPPGCQRRATPSYNAPLPTATSPTGPHPATQRGVLHH